MISHNFVYGIGQDLFVELRSSIKPPKKLVSKLTDGKKVIMHQVHFVGGKVVAYVPRYTFYRLFGKIVIDGQIHQLTREQSKNVLTAAWRRKHLK